MPLPEFTLYRPKKLSEALDLMVEHENVKPIAGGTDLIPQLREGEIETASLVDLQYLHSLKSIKIMNGFIRIGALVTLTELIESSVIKEKIPILSEVAKKNGKCSNSKPRNIGRKHM